MDDTDESRDFLRGLETTVPLARVEAILHAAGRTWRNRRLPMPKMVLLVVAMGLFARLSIPMAWRRLHPSRRRAEPVESAFVSARQRLGVRPLREALEQLATPLADPTRHPGAFWRGLRLMAIDGTVFDLPDTPENAKAFGRPSKGKIPGAFPQAQVLALCELGTHAIVAAQIKPCRRSEQKMLGPLLKRMGPDMLLIWDRGFFGYPAAAAALATGARLLARAKAKVKLPVLERLADGSWITELAPPRGSNKGCKPLRLRAIAYTHDDPNLPGCGERHLLATDVLDPQEMTVAEAVALYHERWEEESALDELKTHLACRPVPLRSKLPDLVVQELYGLLLAHRVLRQTIADAAATTGVDPDRLSFVGTLRIIESRLPEALAAPLATWYALLLQEVARQTLRPRRNRRYPRAVKKPIRPWPKKRVGQPMPPQPTKPFAQSVVMLI